MAHDVFISYSSKDKPIADAVCATLEGSKIRCWIAPRDVLPGVPYGEALINALNQSRLLVLVFSADANNSPQVMREVERAVNKNIPIIPFRIENVLPSKSMEFFRCYSLAGRDDTTSGKAFTKIECHSSSNYFRNRKFKRSKTGARFFSHRLCCSDNAGGKQRAS